MKEPSHRNEVEGSADYLEILYRRHFQGALVRSGASAIMWFFALVAFLTNAIRMNHFMGITLSVLYLILINPPTLLLLKRITQMRLYRYASLLINFLEILGYTAIIHFLGGIEATYITPIYAALITYVGVVSPRSFPFVISIMCSAAFSFVVAGEYLGFLPHENVLLSYNPPLLIQLANLSVVIGLLFVVAYISSLTGSILKKSRNKLREKNLEIMEKAASLEEAEKGLRRAHQELENRVEERTAELREANDRLSAEIRERKQTEEALRKSEDRYRTLFEESRDAIYTTSQEGEILDANESMLNLFGYSRGEMIGLQARETYVHSEDRLKFKQKIEQEGFVRDYEIKLRKKDGTEMDCLLTAIVRRTADGNIFRYQGIVRDITERKRAEEEYRTILRTTMDGFWITNIQGRFLDVNDAYCHLIGYSRDELLTMSISDVEAVERPEETAQRIQRIVGTGGARFETRHRCKDGEIIDVEVSVNYTKIGGERLYVFLRDITEPKRAEEALRESEVRYRLLAENASDIIWTVNMNMQVIYISPSVTRLLRYTVEEAKSRTMEEAFTPASLEIARWAFAEEMALENARQGDPNRSRILELELTCKDGGVVPVEANFSFLRDAMGKPVGILSIARDITERKRAEEERKKLIHELQDALVNLKTLRGLLPICSHCKKIRDDKGYWNQIESYIRDHSGAEFTHGICPECMKKLYPDLVD